ncbi:ATPase, T2SS/T4P/T4SS family [Paenalcaligenes niemegkensis]|uniref:ATPase, T2SS/T4P/T4SS family n=1 Tax=Paenalcaligenes niemegkensis TaxID=2895469 RepID=UPI001EE980B6|nr:ATPase, T2SS/T4P/T4SS family [Paenalcaligenes niemegkensis]MCQ9616746.1 ATPase, T2SS/T4P/T4SS family [Paenalcaligenes niemegkensis]
MLSRLMVRRRLSEPELSLALLSDDSEAIVIDTQAALHSLSARIERGLGYELGVQEMHSTLFPVMFEDQSAAILCTADYADSAYATELIRLMASSYRLASPARYVLNLAQLLSVVRLFQPSRQGADLIGLNLHEETAWDQGELFIAFLALVEWGVKQKASDLHINVLSGQTCSEIRYTIDGRYICPAHFQGMSTSMVMAMLSAAWMNIEGGNGAVFDPHEEQQGSLQCSIQGMKVVLRWASLAAEAGPSVCLRLLVDDATAQLPCISSLGYSAAQQLEIEQAMLADGGAVLFSGVVGSGKSTSLAALVAALPPWRKVITVEDPVEQRIPNAVQNSLSRNLAVDSHNGFASKLRALKRSAMTDVLLGEIRDHETGRAFSDLASAGVRVYSTVHAGSAALIPQRLASDFIGVSPQLMAAPGILRLLIHQMLVSTLCKECALPLARLKSYPSWLPARVAHSPDLQQWLCNFERAGGSIKDNFVRNTAGCPQCRRESVPDLNGYAGRTVVAEVLDPNQNRTWLEQIGRLPSVATSVLSVKESAYQLQYGSGSLVEVGLQKCNTGLLDAFDLEQRIGGWGQHA